MKIYTGTTERVRPWGTETIMFDVEMDLRVLNAMARKASSNKTMKSTDGPLTVHVIGTVGAVDPPTKQEQDAAGSWGEYQHLKQAALKGSK